jgi:ribokinase
VPHLIALGDINIDIIARFPSYPRLGGDALATAAEMHCGGSSANTAVILSQLGIDVGLIGRLGADPWGERALTCLRQAGVDVQGVQRDPSALTGMMYIVVTPDGERTMLGHRGANARTNPRELDRQYVQTAGWFHLSGYSLLQDPQRSAALVVAEWALQHGLQISLDPGVAVSQRAVEEMQALLPAVDWILPNLAEAQALTAETAPQACAARLRELGAGAVALKLGAEGCLVMTGEGWFRLPAFVVPARDSTGAGDAFAAGLIGGLVGGLAWRPSALLGCALGALVTSRLGAGTAAPTRSEVRTFLQARMSADRWAEWTSIMGQILAWLDASGCPA